MTQPPAVEQRDRTWARWELWVRYLLAGRVSLCAWAFLVILLPFVLGGSGMVANLLVTENGWQFFWSVLLAFSASLVCGLSLLLTLQYAPLRLGLPAVLRPGLLEGRLLANCVLSALVALPLVAVLWNEADLGEGFRPLLVKGAAVLGSLAHNWLLLLVTDRLRRPLEAWLARRRLPFELPRPLAAGYVEGGRVLVDHLGAIAFWSILSVLYWAGYLVLDPAQQGERFPPLAFLLILHMLVTATLAGLAFFVDRFRIPSLLPVVLWVALIYALKDTDHFFSVWALDRGGGVEARVQPAPAAAPIERWLARRGQGAGKPVLVVLCSSGGGIQAAAWTVEVLCGLRHALGPEFLPSIRFVSAVSGGSVGVMHFLARFPDDGSAPAAESLEVARELAGRSSLSASIWGIVYPDFLRATFPLPVLDVGFDRARALEEAWRRPLRGDPRTTAPLDARLGEWAARTAAGTLPGMVLNATVVETGERMLFSTVAIPIARKALSFLEHYGGRDVDVVSAARMSATFPYVTPVARARVVDRGEAVSGEHVADGGYFDNFGVYSAVEWLDGLLGPAPEGIGLEDMVEKVLVLEIRAFPETGAHAPGCGRTPAGGLTYELAGPLQAMLAVRTSTQTARNDTELALLRARWPELIEESIIVRPPGPLPAPTAQAPAVGPAEAACWCESAETPLSWHLSRAQQRGLEQAWSAVAEDALERLVPYFGRAPAR